MMMTMMMMMMMMMINTVSSSDSILQFMLTRGTGVYAETRCSSSGDYASAIRTASSRSFVDGVSIDMGGFVWGPSLMTRTQRLDYLASNAFARSEYDAFALNVNDLVAGYKNVTAQSFFQTADSGSPIVTNLESTSSVSFTIPYKIVEKNNLTVAVLSLLDATKLSLVFSPVQYRFRSYDVALTREIKRIKQDRDVDIVALLVDSISESEDICLSGNFSSLTYLESLVRSHIDIDIVFHTAGHLESSSSVRVITNWFDKQVFLVSLQDGDVLHRVNLTIFSSNSTISNVAIQTSLTCNEIVVADSVVQSKAAQIFNEMNEDARTTIVANLSQDLSSNEIGSILCDAIADLNVDFAMILNQSVISQESILQSGIVLLDNITNLFHDDSQIAVIDMMGAEIRSAVQSAILSSSSSSMHFSSNVSGSYHYTDGLGILDSIQINNFDLSDNQEYKVGVVTTSSISSSSATTLTGISTQSQFAEFLEHVLESSSGTTARLVRTSDISTIFFGLLCGARPDAPNPTEQEECDHAKMMVDLLNNKTDGFLDDILPHARIQMSETFVGCVNNLTVQGLETLVQGENVPVAIVGPSCSTDVAEITSSSFRDENDFRAVIVSPSSTAPSIANETEFPNVARLSTSEDKVQAGLREVAIYFGWKKLGIIHTDSYWGSQSASKFKETFTEAEVLHEVEINLNTFDTASDPVTLCETWLQEFEDRDVRVMFLYLEPRVSRMLYATVYQRRVMFGPGYAYINGWVTESIIVDDNGEVDLDAMQGAYGSIGLIEKTDTTSDLAHTYTELWGSKASKEGCEIDIHQSTGPYCDIDDDSRSIVGYGGLFADSVLLLALALNRTIDCVSMSQDQCAVAVSLDLCMWKNNTNTSCLYLDGAVSEIYQSPIGKNSSLGNLLYENILNLDSFEGVTSGSNNSLVHLDNNGDRLGTFYLKNLRVRTTQSTDSSSGRRLSISLSSSFAEFANVGEFDFKTGLSINDGDCPVTWSGDTCVVPSDVIVTSSDPTMDTTEVMYTIVAPSVCGVGILMYCLSRHILARQRKRFENAHNKEIGDLQKKHLKTKQIRQVELVSIVREQHKKVTAFRHHDDDGSFPWIISKHDIEIKEMNNVTNDMIVPLYDGEVKIGNTQYDCKIKIFRDRRKSFKKHESGLDTPRDIIEVASNFDVEVIKCLMMLSQNKGFQLFIGVGVLNFSSFFCVYNAETGQKKLNHSIWNPTIGVKWKQRLTWCKDIVSAVHFLHQRNIVHGNLRSSNILTTSEHLLGEEQKKRRHTRRQTIRRVYSPGMDSLIPSKSEEYDWEDGLGHATLGDPFFETMIHIESRLYEKRIEQFKHPTVYLWYAPELLILKNKVLGALEDVNKNRSTSNLERLRRFTSFDLNDPSCFKLSSDVPEPHKREDIYALGIIIHEITELRSPYDYSKRVHYKKDSNVSMSSPKEGSSRNLMTSKANKNRKSKSLSAKLSSHLFTRNRADTAEFVQSCIEADVLKGKRPKQIQHKTIVEEEDDDDDADYSIGEKFEKEIIKKLRKISRKCWRQDPSSRPRTGYILSVLNSIYELTTKTKKKWKMRKKYEAAKFAMMGEEEEEIIGGGV